MANGRERDRLRDNRQRVRALFLREWDPIGLFQGGVADPLDDEYDAYVDKAYDMLMGEQADAAAIATYLCWVATEYICMSNHADQRARSDRTARLLVAMRPEFCHG